MKRNILKLLSLVLVVALLASLAACKPKKAPDPPKKPNNDVSADVEQGGDDGDLSIGGDIDEEPGREIIVSLAATDGKISSGIKLDYDGDDFSEFGEDILDEDLGDLDSGSTATYEPLIQKFGSKVSGSKNVRDITVNNSKKGIAYKGFEGIGCNVYPTQSTLDSQSLNESRKAFLELQAERFNKMHGPYARSWFQIDWMMTDYAGDDYKKYERDWKNNPDYKAYYNGEYDFESEQFQSCIDYWSMLGEVGTRVEVAFGWKVATRIQSWFSQEPARARMAAPRDLDQYADAAYKMFLYLIDKGVTNVDILGFYNEPSRVEDSSFRGSWDYAVLGDKRIYWAKMAQLCKDKLRADKRTKQIEIWGAENSDNVSLTSDKYVSQWIYLNYPELLDVVTMHPYGFHYNDEGEGFYSRLFDSALTARNFFGDKKLIASEFYAADRQFTKENVTSDDDKNYIWYDADGWCSSYAAYFIAMANTGWSAMLNWGFVGGKLPDPVGFDPANGLHSSWIHPTNDKTVGRVQYQFYEQSLLNNYVPDMANVHKVTWEGNDIRTAAFTSADRKDFALLVEKNEGTAALTFNARLKESLGGKTIYVYRFTFESSEANTLAGIQTTVPTLYDTISNVTKTINYTEKAAEKGLYTFYIFSTIKPIQQIALYKEGTGFTEQAVYSEVRRSQGGTISIEPRFIDCQDSGVKWEIKRYSCVPENEGTDLEKLSVDKVLAGGDLGTLTQSGNVATYKLPSDAKAGDLIALRCTINGTNGKRFAAAMIYVKD